MSAIAADINWPQELECLAREAEKEALAKADDIFAEAAAEHERQTAGYSFECRRRGDFLSVFIERAGNEASPWSGEPGRKVSTSLNIGNSKEIKLSHGHCFDRRGEIGYYARMVRDDGSSSGWGTGYGKSAPADGYHYEVSPQYPYIPTSRAMVVLDPEPKKRNRGMSFGLGDHQPSHTTHGYPRPAKDDEIRFNGIGVTICAPAGKGQEVYDSILAEIASGYEPPR